MTAKYYKDDDILYLQLKDTAITGGRQIDDAKHLDLDEAGDVCGIVLQGVSGGVDLDGVPTEMRPELNRLLQEAQVKVKEAA